MEHTFTCGHLKQTTSEGSRDGLALARLKSGLESAIPGSELFIENATEWATHWHVPYVITCATITENHFAVVRGYGARLCMRESFDQDEHYTHYVTMQKYKSKLRYWKYRELVWMCASILTFVMCCVCLARHVAGVYGVSTPSPMG